MPDFTDRVKQLVVDAATPEDREILVKTLQKEAQPVFQAIFDRGHSDAAQRAKVKLEESNNALTLRDQELQAERDRVRALQADKPDVAKVEKQYQDTIADLKEKHKRERDKLSQQVSTERSSRVKSDLLAAVTGREVDPDYAAIQVERVANRLRFTDDGKLEVLAEGKDIPLMPGDGETPIGLLAKEIRDRTPPKFLISRADTGSGVQNGTNSSTGMAGSKALFYARQREEVRAKYGNGGDKPQGVNALVERMNGTRISA